MSRIVIPPAYNEMMMSSRPPSRRAPLGTSRGSNVPARSRGISRRRSPTSVATVFGVVPLREFGVPRPAASPFSYPRCAVCSAARPRSRTALIISGMNPPSPVNCSEPASIRDIRSSSNPASIISLIACRAAGAEPGTAPTAAPCCGSSVMVTVYSHQGGDLVHRPPDTLAHDAIAEIQRYGTKGYRWVLDADIEACFDSISHPALLDRVRARVKDKRVLALVKAFLKAGILTELGQHQDTLTGTPQGGILSPLLANIALSALDE